MRLRSAFAALLLLVSSFAAAQESNSNIERGFDPQKAYAFDEIGAVNLFNGNLNLPIPVGQAYPVSQTLSWQLVLHYGGNNWTGSSDEQFERNPDGTKKIVCDESGCHAVIINYAWSYPSPRDNAGFGWRLSLGRLDPDLEAIPVFASHVYESADGGTHAFYPTLHPCADTGDTVCTAEAKTDVFYTRDGSYLRLREDGTSWKIDFPDGTVHTFHSVDPQSTDRTTGMVNEIADAHGNKVTIEYNAANAPAPQANFTPSRVWKITDSRSRTSYVYMKRTASFHEDRWTEETETAPPSPIIVEHESVAEIHLQVAAGTMAVWSLQYENENEPAASQWTTLVRKCTMAQQHPALGPNIKTALLRTLTLPDGTTYTFDYDRIGILDCDESSGALTTIVPPTKAEISFEYERHSYPPNSHLPRNHKNPSSPTTSIAVKKRVTRATEGGTILGTRTWEYASDPFIDLPETEGPKEKSVIVTDFEGNGAVTLRKSQHFFSVCPDRCTAPSRRWLYGLPLTTKQSNQESTGGGGAFLSSITFGDGGDWSKPMKKTYVTYEADLKSGASDTERGVVDLNRRMSGQTTIDITGAVKDCLDEIMTGFDGLGHYRVKAQDGRCDSAAAERTSTTTYNQAHASVGGTVPRWWAADASPRIPYHADETWVLNRFTSQSNSEGASSDLALFAFGNDGLLLRKRVLISGSLHKDDLVAKYSYSAGNMVTEESFGGDGGDADDDLELTPLATMNLPAAEYRTDHTHASGVVRTSKAFGTSFFTLDRDVNSSGLTVRARDTMPGVTTDFSWDTSGRPTSSRPGQNRAWTYYRWEPADLRVRVSSYLHESVPNPEVEPQHPDSSGNVLSRSTFVYDTLGRLTTEQQLQPDRTLGTRQTSYNILGWKTWVSEWQGANDPAPKTTRFQYDALGRTTKVTMPDDQFTTTAYTGARLVARTVEINAEKTAVTTKEKYDAFGRLVELEEPTGDQTTYKYNVQGKLIEVTQGVQKRTFTYDRAGRLTAEDHPESDPVTYTYDSQGRVLTRRVGSLISLKFEYDQAGRLLKTIDAKLSRDLKVLAYDGAWPGRLVQQKRNNYFAGVPTPTAVTDTFEYDTAGRVSKKSTDVGGKNFSQTYEYTQLGNPGKLNFPICPSCSGTAAQPRGIGLSYGAGGALTGITGVTAGTGITYKASGQVHQVRHAALNAAGETVPGVLDTYHPDVMARPKQITFENATACDLINAPSSTEQNIGSGQQAQFTVHSPANDAVFTWYRGIAGDTGNPVTTGIVTEAAPGGGRKSTLTTPVLTETTAYWCRVTRPNSTCSENSPTFVATVCVPPVIEHPVADYAADAVPVLNGSVVEASVMARATSVKYSWQLVNVQRLSNGVWSSIGNVLSLGATPSIAWTADRTGTYGLQVTVTGICAGGSTSITRIVKVISIQPAVSCPMPVLATAFPAQMDVRTGQTSVRLAVTIEPPSVLLSGECAPPGANPPPPWPDDPSNPPSWYYFRWSVDGETKLSGAGQWEYTVDVPTGKAVQVEIWRLCKNCSNEVVANSQHVFRQVYIFNIDNCPPPPLTIDQTSITLPAEGSPKFTANSTWPGVLYQWYKGDSGNTREPISNATGSSYTPTVHGTYWVRARSGCDTHTDSPTLVVKTPSCTPVQFLRQPQSKDVAAGTSHTLDFETAGSPAASSFVWFRGEGSQQVGTSSTYTAAPIRTTSYYAQASSTCSSALSATATLHVVSCSDIQVNQQPANRDIYAGDTTTLSFGATSAHQLAYEWYQGETGDTSVPAVTVGNLPPTSASINVKPSTTTKYWVRVSIAGGCAIDSRTVLVKVCARPVIHGHTTAAYLQSTASWALLSVAASGEKLAYQWYAGETGNTANPLDGKITSFIWVTPDTTSKYWCRVTSGATGLACHTDTATITVVVCSTPAITAQPQNKRIFDNTRATLTVAVNAGSNTEPVTYQWKQENASGQWVNVTGEPSATTASFTTPPLTVPTRYRVEVSAGRCSILSDPAQVTICAFPEIVDATPEERKIGLNETATLSLPVLSPVETLTPERTGVVFTANKNVVWYQGAVGAIVIAPAQSTTLSVTAANITGLTYQWYIGAVGTTTNPAPNGTSSSLTVTPSATTTYWVRVSGPCGLSDDSNAAVVTVCANPGIAIISPSPQLIRAGDSRQLQVRGSGNNLSYQWYIGNSGVTTSPTGTNSDFLTVSPTVTTNYWCRIRSDGVCKTDSPTITVDVCTDPAINTQPASQRVFSGKATTLSVTATSTRTLSYQWYTGSAGVMTNPITGQTGSSVTVSPTAETSYWVRVTTGACSVNSTAATLSMCAFSEVVNGTSHDIGSGESVTLSLPTMSPVVSKNVVWYQGAVGVKTNPVKSGVNVTYTTPALTATTSYWAEFEYQGCVSRTTAYTVNVCRPAITTEPSNVVIEPGQSTTLSVATTSIPGQTFRWYIGPVGTTSNPAPNGTSSTLSVTPAATTTYWVRVTGGCGSDDSNAVTVTVCSPPGIASATASPQYIRSGSPVSLQVLGSGSNLSYQWYVGAKGVTTTPIGTNSDWLTVSPASTTSYWCRIRSNGLCPVDSNAITVDVCTDPSITAHPASQRIFSGKATTLSVTASSPRPLSYQWYTGQSGVTSNPITGQTGATITVSPAVETSYWVQVIVTGACKVPSNTATLWMCAFNEVVNAAVPSQNVAYNGSVTLSLPVLSPAASKNVTWYRGAVGDRTVPVKSGVNVPYTTPALTATTTYWAEFEYEGCVSRTTAYTVNVCNPVIGAHPQDVLVNYGAQAQMSVTASPGTGLTYQWYRGARGDVSSPVTGQTTSVLTIPSATATQAYWVRVTGCSASEDSNAATVTVCTSPAIQSVTKEAGTAYNGTGTLTANATGTNLTYQWYKGQSGVTTSPITGATAAVYSFIMKESEYYWVRVTSACNGVSADSAAIMYSVNPRIQTQPQSVAIPANTQTTLSVSALGAHLGYQWYKNNVAITVNGNGPTYLTEPITAATTYYVRVTSGTQGVETSSQAVVSVCGGPRITNFTSTKLSTSSWRLTVYVFEEDLNRGVKYRWYSGTPGNVSQSVDLGEAQSYRTFYPAQTTTYWVRVWWSDDSCYADTGGRTLTPP